MACFELDLFTAPTSCPYSRAKITINGETVFKTRLGEIVSDLDEKIMDLFFPDSESNKIPVMDRIFSLEEVMLGMDQAEIPVEHSYISGMYKRQITIPKGVIATGVMHKVEHMDVFLSGEMIMITDEGPKHIKAPMTLKTDIGKKKCGYALTDVVWATYHPTDEKDPDKFMRETTTNNINDIYLNVEYDVADYFKCINEAGYSQDNVEAEVFTDDVYLIDSDCEIRKSDIDGFGVFAGGKINKGSAIGVARNNKGRTQFGRYVNHSPKNNAIMRKENGVIYLYAIRDIDENQEITVNYRESLRVR